MAMGTVTATNVKTGAVEVVKSFPEGTQAEIYSAAVTTAFAATDVITGPKIPAGAYLLDVFLQSTDIDSGSTCLLDVGISGTAQKFIAASTVGQAGGLVHATGSTTLGYSPSSDTAVLVTCNATANTAVAGTVTVGITYTQSP